MDPETNHLGDNIFPIHIRLQKRSSEAQGVDLSVIRTFNRRLILNYLREQGATTRVAIANDLGFSRATVSSIIEDLKKDGIVREGEKLHAAPKGGRRATWVHFNANAGYVIGVDVGRAHLTLHLTNLAAETINKWSGPFDMDRLGGRLGLEYVAEKLHDLVASSPVTWNQIRGIGLASPGSPDPNFRMLISPPLLNDWLHIDIPAFLRRKLNLKHHIPIYLAEDGNTGALGESRYGKGRGVANMVYLKIGTGIGSGLILNGQLYVGSRGVAGEIGHVLIENAGPTCPSCGKVGCLEALAGVNAIVEDARTGKSLMESADTTASLPTPALASYRSALDIADVLHEADEGDAACRAALVYAGQRVGRVIGSYILNVYNPSMVLLDGGVVRVKENGAVRLNEIFLTALRESIEISTLPAAKAGTEILVAQLDDTAIALGAVAIAIDNDKEFGVLDEKERGSR